jgi:hypothetical protein
MAITDKEIEDAGVSLDDVGTGAVMWRKWALEKAVESGAKPQGVPFIAEDFLKYAQFGIIPK